MLLHVGVIGGALEGDVERQLQAEPLGFLAKLGKIRERSEILSRFSEGTYGAIATSKVLNEGVDVPDASVAIVISGSGSVREHVQRLGRVLRRKGDKQAILYELVSAGTGEAYTSQRRRAHSAYGQE